MDKFFRDRTTNQPVTREDIQGGNQNRAVPLKLAQSTLDNLNLDVVKETPRPSDTAVKTFSWRPLQLADGTFVQDWVPKYRFEGKALLEPLRAFLIRKVSDLHKERRDGGITFDGFRVGTDVAARTIMSLANNSGTKHVVVKGRPKALSNQKYAQMRKAVDTHVAKCDEREYDLVCQLEQATTVTQLEAVEKEIYKGWPLCL